MNIRTIRMLVLTPTIGAAVLLSAAPSLLTSGSASPAVSGDRIALANFTFDFLPLRPRGEGTEVETAEDAWERIPGGPGTGRWSEGTIKNECKGANGTYNTSTKPNTVGGGTTTFSSCAYNDIGGNRNVDFYVNGRYSTSRQEPQPKPKPR